MSATPQETDPAVSLALGLHINECLLYPENASYVSRSSELIQDSVLEAVRGGQAGLQVRQLCGKALGRVGSLHPHFPGWVGWCTQQLDTADKTALQLVFLTALQESLLQGGGNKEGVVRLLELAKARLEETTSEAVLLGLLGILEAAAKQWGLCFKAIFTEVVDILVGWFMESSGLPDIRVRIGRALLDWGIFWQGELGFAVEQVSRLPLTTIVECHNRFRSVTSWRTCCWRCGRAGRGRWTGTGWRTRRKAALRWPGSSTSGARRRSGRRSGWQRTGRWSASSKWLTAC